MIIFIIKSPTIPAFIQNFADCHWSLLGFDTNQRESSPFINTKPKTMIVWDHSEDNQSIFFICTIVVNLTVVELSYIYCENFSHS